MIPLPGVRDKAGGPLLGARRPGEDGPFGIRPGLEDADPDEDNDGQDPDHDGAQHLDQPNERNPMGAPALLDLCCGAGGLARGYANAGFTVTGIDLHPMPNYPYTFHQADALEYLERITRTGEIERYDLVHASWTCQRWARVTSWRGSRDDHPDLLTPGKKLQQACGRPWVIENVPEAAWAGALRPDYILCGSQFGLKVRRHRVFETSWGGGGELLPPCWHPKGRNKLMAFEHKDERAYADAMGCTWMSKTEARQAVPPAYSEWIGRQFLQLRLDSAA